jgi:hypothetical protein
MAVVVSVAVTTLMAATTAAKVAVAISIPHRCRSAYASSLA